MLKSNLFTLHYPPPQIIAKREEVRRELLQKSPHLSGGRITRIFQSDLKLLFDLYDRIFFHNYFRDHFTGRLLLSFSTRMTKNAGMTVYPRNLKNLSPKEERYELRISAVIFFSYDKLERDKVVNGVKTRDSLEALQLVFEHELCHLIELHCFKESSCRQERFQSLALNLFGHTESCHQLPLIPEIATAKYGLSIGDRVSFQVEGKTFDGIICRITKRATVMVPDAGGLYRDRAGKRYSKYYVPLALLKKR
ncbi:MAG TPA: hypothetical protein PKV91_04020 [Bacillota bacterium]|jgi:hypothetical protein|nr:SprT family zinc-dependent metalloprotease [Bacillota bacterium]HOA35246.1 hypothetical protein [Bacillota bacterium]HOL16333.1 hypothetical protein [Bacillota bacterium]HPZ11504.1 hypothetical protein [Bacillota bacterium]HQE09773.1 hypothetical protein [Bacillota bacterium]